MKLTHLEPGKTYAFRPPDAFSVLHIEGAVSLSKVLDAVDALRAKSSDGQWLITLDDPGQCKYTSMHCRMRSEQLYLSEEDDLDADDSLASAAFEKRQLAHAVAAFDAPASRVDWRALKIERTSLEDIEALVLVNERPERLLNREIYVQHYPVARPDLLIAGLPNGYFEGDLGPFENHALIRRMADYGYRYFGIGASWLGFRSDEPLNEKSATALIDDLSKLYAQPEPKAAWARLLSLMQNRNTLFLGYTESFADTLR